MKENNINLLFVDDEEEFLNSMSRRLSKRGFNVITVNRGEKAVTLAKSTPFDIAMIDMKMPGIGGEETLKAIKEENKYLEAVILSGNRFVGDGFAPKDSAAFLYLQKPCELDKILEALNKAYQKTLLNRKA